MKIDPSLIPDDEGFLGRALHAIDDGFAEAIENEAAGVIMRIAGGADVAEAMQTFQSIFTRTVEARNRVMQSFKGD